MNSIPYRNSIQFLMFIFFIDNHLKQTYCPPYEVLRNNNDRHGVNVACQVIQGKVLQFYGLIIMTYSIVYVMTCKY